MSRTYFKRGRVCTEKLTVAQVNAGVEVVIGDPQRIVRVVDVHMRAIGGNVATATGVKITNTAGTTDVVTFATAGLTSGSLVRAGGANTTLGAGFSADLVEGQGLSVIKVGDDVATATHVEIVITYVRS